MKHFETTWVPENKLIVSHLSGDITIDEIEEWERSLEREMQKIQDNDEFKIFINLHGFTAIDLDAHKRFRNIVPLTLAAYGWKVGYVDLFEEESKKIKYSNTRGIKCIAAAHAHQDAVKIEKYESNYSRANEHYFTDPDKALNWIKNYSGN
jgi:hypothetical protein